MKRNGKQNIKEIYNYHKQEPDGTNLIKQYNEILDKTPEDLTISDLGMMLRQGLFPDISVPKAIDLIMKDPSIGDQYDYELLINLGESNINMKSFKQKLLSLIDFLANKYSTIDFEIDSDRRDYLQAIENIKNKIA